MKNILTRLTGVAEALMGSTLLICYVMLVIYVFSWAFGLVVS
jgi:hypothetical protein